MNDIPTALRSLVRQEQFLDVVDRDTATARFYRHLDLRPLGAETVPLSQALGRVPACPVIADVDVPGFDRARSTSPAARQSLTRRCRSAPNGDPGEMGRRTLILPRKSAPGAGSRSAPIVTPSRHLFCGQFQCLPVNSRWGPDWVLKHTVSTPRPQ
jgi:hypothetical protein